MDTTSALGSVALADDSILLGEERLTGPDTHSLHLLPAIDRVLKRGGLDAFGVEGFAVAVGPGSFTGLRVGLSTVQGLALATGRPCLGASVLDVLASTSEGVVTLTLRDAFRGEVYWASYDAQGRAKGAPRVGPLDEALAQAPPGAAFVGDGVASHREVIALRFPDARFPPFPPFLAAALASWAAPRLRAGLGSGPASLRPLYVRGADIRQASA